MSNCALKLPILIFYFFWLIDLKKYSDLPKIFLFGFIKKLGYIAISPPSVKNNLLDSNLHSILFSKYLFIYYNSVPYIIWLTFLPHTIYFSPICTYSYLKRILHNLLSCKCSTLEKSIFFRSHLHYKLYDYLALIQQILYLQLYQII